MAHKSRKAATVRKHKQAAWARLDVMELLDLVGRLSDAGDKAGQLEAYAHWLAANPGHPLGYAAWFNLGCAHMSFGDQEAACEAFSAALRQNTGFLQAACNLGTSLERLGRHEEALAAWERIVTLPDERAVDRNLLLIALDGSARALTALGRTEAAGRLLARSRSHGPATAAAPRESKPPAATPQAVPLTPVPLNVAAQAGGQEPSAHIYQICYSQATLQGRDPGFLCLECLDNPRPDWREYWHMRRFLLDTRLSARDYYGFFSPKFKAKTGLDAAEVQTFIREHGGRPDVFLFSPFFDQGAFALNVFEQGLAQHADIQRAFTGSVALVAPEVNLGSLVMDSRHVVFCNYIVARPAFWQEWLRYCEPIFAAAEAGDTGLAESLNASTNHDGSTAPNKVFVMERVASLILSTQPDWKVAVYNPMRLPLSTAQVARYPKALLRLDALKIASRVQGFPHFMAEFAQLREGIVQALQHGQDRPEWR